MSIVTLLQISDLHFGVPDSVRLDASLDAVAPNWWSLHPLFDGFLGHCHEALVALEELYDELRESEERLSVVASGDITASGGEAQFQIARSFLEEQLLDPLTGIPVGLRLGPQLLQIPGNHDHWPGSQNALHGPLSGIVGKNPYLDGVLGSYPRRVTIPIPGSGRSIRIVLMSSDADVGEFSLKRIYARGSFASQCDEARRLLADGNDASPAIKVIVIHHSFIGAGYALGVDAASRAAFLDLIDAADVDVVLTGHKHSSEIRRMPAKKKEFVEMRCGTTTQRDNFPEHWRIAKAQQALRLRRLEPNSALVHRVAVGSTRFSWQVDTYVRRRDRFETTNTLLFQFPT